MPAVSAGWVAVALHWRGCATVPKYVLDYMGVATETLNAPLPPEGLRALVAARAGAGVSGEACAYSGGSTAAVTAGSGVQRQRQLCAEPPPASS